MSFLKPSMFYLSVFIEQSLFEICLCFAVCFPVLTASYTSVYFNLFFLFYRHSAAQLVCQVCVVVWKLYASDI